MFKVKFEAYMKDPMSYHFQGRWVIILLNVGSLFDPLLWFS